MGDKSKSKSGSKSSSSDAVSHIASGGITAIGDMAAGSSTSKGKKK